MTSAPSPVIQLRRARVQTELARTAFLARPSPPAHSSCRELLAITRSFFALNSHSTPLGHSMCKDQIAMTSDSQQTAIRARRNGMGNIFDGIDPALFVRLGLSQSGEKVTSCAQKDSPVSTSCLADILGDFGWHQPQDKSRVACWEQLEILGCLGESCCSPDAVRPFRPRSFSCSLQLDVCTSLAQRRRRNAMADLFSSMSSSQRQALLDLAASSSSSSTAASLPPTPLSPVRTPEAAQQVPCS